MSSPLISIIMPAHNAAPFIGEAIQSVLEQTYPHWELLIADDASTDDTEQVVRSYLSDARIRYQKLARVGRPAGVRNAALRQAQGSFIAFLDADDRYYADTLQRLLTPLLADPERIAAYGFAFQIDPQGQPLTGNAPLRTGPPGQSLHSWERIVTSQISCLLSALLLRRSAWEQIGYFNESLSGTEDYEFYVRMFLHKHSGVWCLNDYIYQYRIHPASLTKSPQHYQGLLESCLQIMHWMFTEAPIPESLHSLKSQAYLACYRYLARERLLNQQPQLARILAWQSFRDSHIRFTDALRGCGPLFLRSFLPSGLDELLVQARRLYRKRRWPHKAIHPHGLREEPS